MTLLDKADTAERTAHTGHTKPGTVARSPNYPFEIIHPIIRAIPPEPEPTFTFWNKPNDTSPMGTIVYFMYSAGRIKIGFSSGLLSRHTTLKMMTPFPPVVLLVVSGTLDTERQFHDRFPDERLHGEWFTLSKKMRNFFRARLCPVGRASLKTAEAEFHTYCRKELGL